MQINAISMVLTAISMISWWAEIDRGDCDDWLMWWCTPYWFKLRQKTDIFYVDEDADVGDYDGDIVHQVDGDEKLDPVRLAFLPLHALYTLDSAPTLQSCIWYNVAVDMEGVSANICGVWDKDDDNGDSNIRGDDDDDDSDDGFKMSDGDDSDDGSKWTMTMTVMMVPNDRYSQEVASFQGGVLDSVNGKLVNSKPFLHSFGLKRIHRRFKSGYITLIILKWKCENSRQFFDGTKWFW